VSNKAGTNGDTEPGNSLGKIRDAIRRAQNQGEREEQAAFRRTHTARERARRDRVRARKGRRK